MSKSTAPGPSLAPEDLLIEIDPSLIEEALAAVERIGRHAAESPPGSPSTGASSGGLRADGEPESDEIDVVLDAPGHAPEADDERRRLHFRVREQQDLLRRLERDLARGVEARDALDRQVRELRKAHSDLAVDYERFRNRARKDVEEAERRGEDRALRPIVDVYDNVERAWLHAVSDPAQILGGLQMIVEQFKRLLARLGFERVDADRGMRFDPVQHEAVLHVQDTNVPPGMIVDEVHAGFRLRGRLFRPARVTVSAPPPGSEA